MHANLSTAQILIVIELPIRICSYHILDVNPGKQKNIMGVKIGC